MNFSVFYRVTLFGGSLLVLAACDPVGTPGWMPNGYRFQDDTPLSSPAPSRPWVDEAAIHDTEKLASNTAAWQGAVFELVEKISPSLPTDGSPLFLQEPVVKTAQNQALDHYLRQALMQKGFTLTTTPGFGQVLQATAGSLMETDILKLAQKEDKFEKVSGADMRDFYRLSLAIVGSKEVVLAKSSVIATLPFEKREYLRLPGFSYQPVAGQTRSPQKVYNRQ
jgi:hypothetical protein